MDVRDYRILLETQFEKILQSFESFDEAPTEEKVTTTQQYGWP